MRLDPRSRLTALAGGPARARVVALLALVLALQSADTATIGASGAQIESSLGIGNAALGALASVTVLMGAIGAVPGGMLADRIRRTRLLESAIVAWGIALIAGAASTSFAMLLATRVALGIVVAAAGPSIASLTGDFFAAEERARVYGLILTGEMVGGAFGFLVSGEVASLGSWRLSFALLAVLGFALAWALRRWLHEPARGRDGRLPGRVEAAEDDALAQAQVERHGIDPRRELVVGRTPSSTWSVVRYVLAIPTNRLLILSSSLGYFFLNGLQTFAVIYLKRHFGVGQGAATALLALLVVFSIAGAVGGGRLADSRLAHGHLAARITLPGVAYLLASAAFAPGLALGSPAVAAPLYMTGALALAATNPPLDAARLDIVPGRLWGRAEGVRTVFRSVAQALAPLSFGIVSEQFGRSARAGAAGGFGSSASGQGLEYTFLIMLSVLLLSGIVMLRARRTYARDVATAVESERRTRTPVAAA